MNKFFLSTLLVSTSFFSTLALAAPPFNRGLSDPFASKGKIHLAPIVGMEEQHIREIRFHGNYGSQKSNFPRVKHNLLKEDDTPQDAVAAFLQRLFPSPAHDVLTSNTLQQDKVRKWLTPAAIAKIFNSIDDHKKYAAMSEDERLAGLLAALTPEAYDRFKKTAKVEAEQNKKKEWTTVLVSKFKDKAGDSFNFAKFLDEAILKSRNPNPEDKYFYPPHIIESALLIFMRHQTGHKTNPVKEASLKEDLEQYCDTLSADLMDKTVPVNFDSFYTKEDYFDLKNKVNSGDIPIQEFMKDPEKITLLAHGYSYFEDPLPPVFPYGPVKFIDPDGKVFSYTNCGEMLLMTLFDMVNFDPEERNFAASRLENLKEKGLSPHKGLLKFYSEINTHPTQSNTQASLNGWSQLVSNLNAEDDPDPIHYLKDKGRKVKTGNGIYELGNGLHNLLRVVGKLLGDPQWQPMNQTGKDLSKAIQANLDRFCELFSRDNAVYDWHAKDTKTKEIKDSNRVEIVFKTKEKDLFKLYISPGHFQFEKSYESGFTEIGKKMIPHLYEWHPLYRHFIKPEDTTKILDPIPTEHLDTFFNNFLYSMDLDSIDGKFVAMKAIVAYENKFKKSRFSEFINKWLTRKGEHFENWSDRYTNFEILNWLSSFKTIKEIQNLGIKEFNAYLSPDQLKETISIASHGQCKYIVDLVLKMPGVLESLWNQPLPYIDEEDFEINNVPSSGTSSQQDSLFHRVAELGLNEFITKCLNLGADVNAPGREGHTALHLAVMGGHADTISLLIKSGAHLETLDDRGDSPLHYAIFHNRIGIMTQLIELGANIEAKDRYGFTPLLNAILHNRIDFIRELLKGGANSEAKDEGRTPLQLAILMNDKIAAIDELLKGGANSEAKDDYGMTPLLNAILSDKIAAIDVLLKGGANIEAKDEEGQTPLQFAISSGKIDIATMLREHGAKE